MSITEEEIYKKLIHFIGSKSQRQAARELGMTHAHLHDILHKRRSVSGSEAILKKFGLRRAIVKRTS